MMLSHKQLSAEFLGLINDYDDGTQDQPTSPSADPDQEVLLIRANVLFTTCFLFRHFQFNFINSANTGK